MHCTSCEMLIKGALEDETGINNIKASHKTNSVQVDFDNGKITESQISKIISEEGFKVEN